MKYQCWPSHCWHDFFMQAVLDCCSWRWQNPRTFSLFNFSIHWEDREAQYISDQFTSLSDIVSIFNWTILDIYIASSEYVICRFSFWLPLIIECSLKVHKNTNNLIALFLANLKINIYFQFSILIILHYKSHVAFILVCIGYHTHYHYFLHYLVKLL